MLHAKLIHSSILALLAVVLIACAKGPEGQASAVGPSGPARVRLEVDTEHWPVDVLGLARTTIKLVQKRGEPGYLAQIDIQLPQKSDSTPLTAVDYTFYLPRTRKRLSVSYVNTDASLPPDQMKMAQQAGVADVMKRAQEEILEPKFTEMSTVEGRATPVQLPGARIDLRDAYARARQHGLTRADHVSLSVSTKDPNALLVLWNFQGQHTQEDSQGIHIDALTGDLVDEDRINDLSRAERNARLQKALEALQSLARPSSAGGLSVGPQQKQLSCPQGYIGIGNDCIAREYGVGPATVPGQ